MSLELDSRIEKRIIQLMRNKPKDFDSWSFERKNYFMRSLREQVAKQIAQEENIDNSLNILVA